jgi:hypothetical protein
MWKTHKKKNLLLECKKDEKDANKKLGSDKMFKFQCQNLKNENQKNFQTSTFGVKFCFKRT